MRTRTITLCGMAALISPQSLRRMALTQYAAHIDGLSGKVGNAVFSKARGGTTMRKRVVPHNPRTLAQQAARSSLSQGSKAFSALTPTQRTAWDSYAASDMRTNRLTGQKFSLSAVSAFTSLSTKVLQVTPGAVIPLAPPSTPYAGDTITLTAIGGVGLATITASGANNAASTTEILAVRVASTNRRPAPGAFRHKAFHVFAAGALTSTVPLAKGLWEIAVRFVDIATGEQTLETTIATVTVT